MSKPKCFGKELRIYGIYAYYCTHHPNCLFRDDCYNKLIESLSQSLESKVKNNDHI